MMRFVDPIVGFLRTVPVRKRILAGFFLLSLVPLFLASSIAYTVSSNAMVKKLSEAMLQNLSMAKHSVSYAMKQLENNCIEFAFLPESQAVLSGISDLGEFEQFQLQKELQVYISNQFALFNYVSDVGLVTDDLEYVSAYSSRPDTLQLSRDLLEALVQKTRKASGQSVLAVIPRGTAQEQENSILLCRIVNDLTTGDRIGYVIICFDETFLKELCAYSVSGEGSFAVIVDNAGTIITSTGEDYLPADPFPHSDLVSSLFVSDEVQQALNYEIDGQEYLVGCAEILEDRWYMLDFVPYRYLEQENMVLAKVQLGIGVVCAIVCMVIAALISRSINQPLDRLLGCIARVNRGEYRPYDPDTGQDEIALVNNSFNAMTCALSRHLDEIKMIERERKELELRALLAQINPHFLANTLNEVKWMAEMQGADNIASLVVSLTHILQATMGTREWVQIREEFSVVEDYISVQKYRYLDKFDAVLEIEEGTEELWIPRFILQPVVENSIVHGVADMQGLGEIRISSRISENCLLLCVADNGLGMEPDEAENLLAEQEAAHKARATHIGVRNTDTRIKLACGSEFGLQISAQPGRGTTVLIRLPIVSDEPGGTPNDTNSSRG